MAIIRVDLRHRAGLLAPARGHRPFVPALRPRLGSARRGCRCGLARRHARGCQGAGPDRLNCGSQKCAANGPHAHPTVEQDFGPDSKSGSRKFETPNRSAFVARWRSFWSVRGKRVGMSAWQPLKSFSGQNRSAPGTSNRQERGSHDAQPCDSSSKNSQAPPADHPPYSHRMIEIVPRQHAAQRAAVRSCSGQGSRIPAPRDRNAQVEGGVGRSEPGLRRSVAAACRLLRRRGQALAGLAVKKPLGLRLKPM